MAESLIVAEGLSKKYCRSHRRGMAYSVADISRQVVGLRRHEALRPAEFWALKDVSFRIEPGQCLGLLGANGAGKSTLLKLLSGIVPPDQGSVSVRGRVGALIEVGAGFHPALSGTENIYVNGAILGMSRREIDQKMEAIVEFSGLDSDTLEAPVRTYSSGMYVRLGFAIAVSSDPDILLVDEVLAVGDINFQAKCLSAVSAMQNRGTAIVVTSHNVDYISGWATQALALDAGRPIGYGPTQEVIQRYLCLMAARDEAASPVQPAAARQGDARIGRARLLNPDGEASEKVRAGMPFGIAVDVVATMPVADAELDVRLYSGQKELLSETFSALSLGVVQLPRGASRFHLAFPPVPLNQGCIRAELSLWGDRRSRMLDLYKSELIGVAGVEGVGGALYWLPRYSFDSRAESTVDVTSGKLLTGG
jgi:lipopolysaccharide transport system ATP-binding protein